MKMPAEEAHERVQNDPDASPYEKMLPLDYFHAIEEAYVDNLNQARNQGTTVIELNVSMLRTDEVKFNYVVFFLKNSTDIELNINII